MFHVVSPLRLAARNVFGASCQYPPSSFAIQVTFKLTSTEKQTTSSADNREVTLLRMTNYLRLTIIDQHQVLGMKDPLHVHVFNTYVLIHIHKL